MAELDSIPPKPTFLPNLLQKSLLLLLLFLLLHLSPSSTRAWELLHLLLVGLAVSYGLFSSLHSSKHLPDPPKPDAAVAYIPSVFDDDDLETPKHHTWSSVRSAPSPTEVSLDLPVRSLKSEALDGEMERDLGFGMVLPSPIPWRSRSGRGDGMGFKAQSVRSRRSRRVEADSELSDLNLPEFGGKSFAPPPHCFYGQNSKFESDSDLVKNESAGVVVVDEKKKKMSEGNLSVPPPPPPPRYYYEQRSNFASDTDVFGEIGGENATAEVQLVVENKLVQKNPIPPPPPSLYFHAQRSQFRSNSDVIKRNDGEKTTSEGFFAEERKAIEKKSSPPPPPPPPPHYFYRQISQFEPSTNVIKNNNEGKTTTQVVLTEEKKVIEKNPRPPVPPLSAVSRLEKKLSSSRRFIVDSSSDESDKESSDAKKSTSGVQTETEDANEVDKKADEFIARFREQIRLQRIESIKRSTGQKRTSKTPKE